MKENFSLAKKLIREASKSGADAVKFQIFNPKTLANKSSKKKQFPEKNFWKRKARKHLEKSMSNFLSIKKT